MKLLNGLGVKAIMVDMFHCADCGTELLVPHLIGKKKKDRRLVCSKCVKNYKEDKND